METSLEPKLHNHLLKYYNNKTILFLFLGNRIYSGKKKSKSNSTSSSISKSAVKQYVEKLKSQANRPLTRKVYYCVWRQSNQFFMRLDEKLKSWEERLVLFVGHLVSQELKSTTIKSYISAIKAVLAEDGIFLDPNMYLLQSLTKACHLKNDKVRIRFPIQRNLLNILLQKLEAVFETQPYLCCLYQTIFLTAYYGLFRACKLAETMHAVKACDVFVGCNKNKLRFTLHTSKTHWFSNKPQIIKISTQLQEDGNHLFQNQTSNKYCLYQLLRNYVEVRRSCGGQHEHFFYFSR